MNKAKVNEYLPIAIVALKKCGIADEKDRIISTYRSNISSFGAAVTMGSFKAAVAFFSADAKDDNSKVSRSKLIQAMDFVVHGKGEDDKPRDVKIICAEVIETNDDKALCEKYINASIGLKLAMNVYYLYDPNKEDGNGKSSSAV